MNVTTPMPGTLRPLRAAGTPTVDAAIRSFVNESNSAEGRRVKTRGMEEIARLATDLTAEHVREIASLVNESTGIEGRSLKMEYLVALFRARPDITPAALRTIASCVNSSETLEGRGTKLGGFERLYRARPDLSEAQLREVSSFVLGSNNSDGYGARFDFLVRVLPKSNLSPAALRSVASCVNASESAEGRNSKLHGFEQILRVRPDLSEAMLAQIGRFVEGSNSSAGYNLKFGYLERMLAVQPKLAPDFVRALADLVDESTGVAGRELKLRDVLAMLEKQPQMTADMLRSVAGYVNESNSLEGRRLKLGSLNSMLAVNPNLSADQVAAIGRIVNGNTGIEARRVAVRGLEEVLKLQPNPAPDTLSGLGSFVNSADTVEGRKQYHEVALQVLQGDPTAGASTFHYMARSTAGAYSAADGSARAGMAFKDVMIARGLGRPVQDLATLAPPASAGGPGTSNVGLPLQVVQHVRARPEVALSDENVETARDRLNHYTSLATAPQSQLFRAEHDRYSAHWENHQEEWKGKMMLAGIAGVVALEAATFFLLPAALKPVQSLFTMGAVVLGFWGTPRLARKFVQKGIEKKIETSMRADLERPRSYWETQLQARQDFGRRLESYLTVDTWQKVQADPNSIQAPGQAVGQSGDYVIIGGVRVPRRAPELDLGALPQGPTGIDRPGSAKNQARS